MGTVKLESPKTDSSARETTDVCPPHRRDELFARVLELASRRDYARALGLINAAGSNAPEYANARGVCLMRLGNYREAVRVLRKLVMGPSATWLRPELPTFCKVNFATALLLAGYPAGCLEVLAEVHEDDDPMVRQLRAAVKRWEADLTAVQRLNWWIGRIEPTSLRIKLDFDPGRFEAPTAGAL